jgi:hypothetical protein
MATRAWKSVRGLESRTYIRQNVLLVPWNELRECCEKGEKLEGGDGLGKCNEANV